MEFYPQREIQPEFIEHVEVDEFKLPPAGTSEVQDFSIECHAEVLPDPTEETGEDGEK